MPSKRSVCLDNKEYVNWKSRECRERARNAAMQAYGNACKLCGITDPDVLTFDHVAQDGAAHRKELGFKGGNQIYTWLRRNNYPPEFRLLCANCNIKVYREFRRNAT